MMMHHFAPGRRALALRALAAGILLAGWADLVAGGISAGPVLVVLGYVVIVPAVILSWR